MKASIVRSTDVERTGRVRQIEGIFDLSPAQKSENRWEVELPLPADWNIGLIVGPSGSGKTTVMRECFGEPPAFQWDATKSILDGFPAEMKVQDVVALLSSVGFSSPPAWLRPYHTLSNGEQFRVTLARTLAETTGVAVVDEFTSVVDRTVAKVGSAAVAKAVRRAGSQLVAVSCHYDVIEWLCPDWIYDTASGKFTAGRWLQRPGIELEIRRADREAWRVFGHHHYLNTSLPTGVVSFVALVEGIPAAFYAATHFVHPRTRDIVRGSRNVCLPDFQGVGIGNAMQSFVGSLFKRHGWRFLVVASHPAMVRSMARSSDWNMTRKPGFVPPPGRSSSKSYGVLKTGRRPAAAHSHLRLTASFEYRGPAATPEHAKLLDGTRFARA